VIWSDDDFTKYDLVIAPMLYSVSDAQGEKLAAYVEQGGTLVCTYATAMVDDTTLAHLGGWPGAGLRRVFGIWNEEIDTLYPDDFNTVNTEIGEVKAVDYCELIHAEGAEVLATYTSDFYAGRPAATVNTYGKGKAYYFAFRDEGNYTDAMMVKLMGELGITSDFDGALPHGVSATSRTDGESVFVFLQNFNNAPVTVTTAKNWVTAEKNTPVTGDIALAPFETVILKKEK
jgi:beta-galactosidase